MSLGMQAGLTPDHTVLDGDPAPTPKAAQQPHPLFGPCLLWQNGRLSRQLLSSCFLHDTAVVSKIHYTTCRHLTNEGF